MFCENCGKKIPDNVKFCPSCGAKTVPAPAPEPQQTPPSAPPAQMQMPPQPQPSAPFITPVMPNNINQKPAKKKSSGKLIALIAAIVLIVVGAGGVGAYLLLIKDKADVPVNAQMNNNSKSGVSDGELPFVSYTYTDKKPEAVIEFTAIDSVFPSNYRAMDSLAVFTGYSDYGDLAVLIEVEIPGFTQLYKQKITLGRQVTKLRILPPLVTGTIDLNSEKMAQLVYSVTEVESGKLLVQESKNIKLYSKFDMVWGDEENWDAFTDNILAWMTPDAPEILSLKRDAIDYLAFISDGALDSIVGYQNYNFFEHYYYNTWVQAVAIQGAMSDIVGVRYNNSVFSMDAQQRIKLPADTLNARSGLCIETSLVMASALQSAGMHAMLIFPPGHAQVAVEAWPESGDYFLIETTVLPMSQDMDTWDYVVQYLEKDEWWGYISGEGEYTYGPCYVVDCDLGSKLGIRAMSN